MTMTPMAAASMYPASGSVDTRPEYAGAIAAWLFVVAALVFVMVVVGGATRLTGSGLSITEWQPIIGVIPPLTEADWKIALEKYRQIPQYQLINKGMSLDAFKAIYWWEWGHRFLGRVIGLAFAVPLVFFIARGAIRGRFAVRMAVLFVLGGLQGVLGWYMVKSGLVDRTDVSQYRLAAHMTFASVLFAALVWTALTVACAGRTEIRLRTLAPGSRTLAAIVVAATFVQIFLGALVAGLKAGLTYNTWPLMDGRFIPNGLGTLEPWWRNLFENVTTVQFDHRIGAYVLTTLVAVQVFRVLRTADDRATRRSALALALIVALQVVIGIWTLLAVVPLSLALLHQAVAILVLGAAVWHAHAVFRRI